MEERNKNLQKLEDGVFGKDDQQLMNYEQGGHLMNGKYHRYLSFNFDKPE